MKHVKADFSKLEIVDCVYHRTYMTHVNPTLLVSIDGEKKEFSIRKRAVHNDRLYHQEGLSCKLVVYNGYVLSYAVLDNANNILSNIKIAEEIAKGDWYFDNEKFYQLNAKTDPEFISVQPINVIDPVHFSYYKTISIIKNDAFVICKDNKILLQTSPISGSLNQNKKSILDNSQNDMFLCLNSLLRLCTLVSKLYGDEEIEKFDIPQYMIRHKTVNLSNLPVPVKKLSTTYVKPLDAISYVLGLIYKEKNHDSNRKLMKMLKHIIRNGIIDARNNESENVYLDKPIELKSLKDFLTVS